MDELICCLFDKNEVYEIDKRGLIFKVGACETPLARTSDIKPHELSEMGIRVIRHIQ